MKIVLFYPKIETSFRSSFIPLGILSIASFLNANGHEAVICDRFFETDSVQDILKKHKPDIIGVSIIAHSFINDAIVISKAAKAAGVPVVWGGSLPSEIAVKCLESDYVDFVSIGEGEITWLEMANAFDSGRDFDNVKGLGFLKNGEFVHTGEREFIDLSTLPNLDWSLIEPKRYFQKSYGYEKQLNTYLSKGCPGRCTYCYNPKFHCSTRRCRPLNQVIDEMRCLVENYGADGFDFTDDAMFINRQEIVDFCSAIKESNLNICWSGYLSVGIVNTLDDYQMMYDAGCRSMIFGIESGSEKLLKSVNKKLRTEKIIENLNLCHKSGIVPIAGFIIGLPGENEEDIKASISLIKALKGTAVYSGYFTPIPGSKAYDDLIAEGKMEPLKTLEDYAKVKETEALLINVSQVKTIDLITVRKYIRLRGLLTKTGHSMKEQVAKILLATIHAWFSAGIKHFFVSSFSAVYNVLRTFTIFFHPKIRKKYGLYFFK